MVEPEELPEFDSAQVTNISQANVQSVHAEFVRMRQADAQDITADEVELQQSAAGNVKANHLSARQSAIATVNAEEVSMQGGAVGYVQAEKASVSGYTGAVVAGSAEVHHSAVGYLAARDVHAEDVRTIVLFARNVQGNVITTFDARGVLIAGLVSGLFGGLMLLLGRFLLRRS